MPQWTQDQLDVIGSSSGRLLCSAAAGSGKTAVMIERIARLLKEGADPFSFLVITFTNAAAAEMKDKIRRRLMEERNNPVLALAAEKSAAMEVCTIHAFCQHLIRQEFQVVGVDPLFRICTGAQRDKLFADAFRKACNELRDREDPDYLFFIRSYEPESARDMVTRLWQFIMSLPDPFGWLAEKTENVPAEIDPEHPWFRTVSKMVREKLLAFRVLLRRQADMFDAYEKVEEYRAVYVSDLKKEEVLRRWAEGQPVTRGELEESFARLPSVRNLNNLEMDWRDRYQELRNRLKDLYGEILSLILLDPEKIRREFGGIRASLKGLRMLTEETHRAYEANKKRLRVLDFSDLEHKALAILADPSCRESVRGRYQRIFVDECQDISSVQDALIQALAGDGNTLFMVGDVKQSIYRFRMANPQLFRNRMEDRESGEALFLRENFRSRPEVLETANTIFRDVMRREAAGVDYRPEDELRAGRKDCPGEKPVQVDLLEPDGERSRLELIADHITLQIREMREKKEYEYRDMVILMPEVASDGAKLADLLKDRNIPAFFDGKGGFFDQPEVEVFRNLLMMLDNPHQDLPLLTILVNPPFRFTEEELAAIRLKDPGRDVPFWVAFKATCREESPLGQKCRDMEKRIERWSYLAKWKSLPEFLWYLADDAGLTAIFGVRYGGRTACKNLRTFCLQADRAAERGIYTLAEFLEYLTEQASGGEMMAASPLAAGDNMVRLMTMHKSKGLQFPVVFCLGLEKSITGGRHGKDAGLQMDEELGLALHYKVPEQRLSRKTAADRIFEWKKSREVMAEKICLLYVAVTRAQERLFLVGTETDKPLWHLPPGDHRTLGSENYLDLIMPALLDEEKKSTTCTQASKPWKLRVLDQIQQETVETGKDIHSLKPWVESLFSTVPVDNPWDTEKLNPFTETDPPLLEKTSVSAVLRQARASLHPEDDLEQTPEEKRTPDYAAEAMRRWRMLGKPAFLNPDRGNIGAIRGTVIHRFLCLTDLDVIRSSGNDPREIEKLRDRLAEARVFTPEEAALIQADPICRFYDSEIGRRVLASPEVHREWDFNLYLEERHLILQGMIDCAFREGDGWILLDYKTDRITDENAFLEDYRPQLEWYALALRQLTGKPVLERWLYALSVDKAYRL